MNVRSHHMLSCPGALASPTLHTARARPRTKLPSLESRLHNARRVHLQADRSSSSSSRIADTESDEDLEKAMEEFLMKQQEKESGGLLAARSAPVEEVVGSDLVTDEEAKKYCREVVRVVRTLKEKRDMSLNEVKLTLAIEDPTTRDQRNYMGVEDESGASRDEVAAALLEVADGKVPKDRIALRQLYREIIEWPFVNEAKPGDEEAASTSSSPYEAITDTGVDKTAGWRPTQARPKMMGRDKSEAPQSFTDTLPDWVGYGFLYFVSVIPVLIAGSVIAILFFNSLR